MDSKKITMALWIGFSSDVKNLHTFWHASKFRFGGQPWIADRVLRERVCLICIPQALRIIFRQFSTSFSCDIIGLGDARSTSMIFGLLSLPLFLLR